MKREEEEIRDAPKGRLKETAAPNKKKSARFCLSPRQSRFPRERDRERERHSIRFSIKPKALRRRRGGKERQRARERDNANEKRPTTTHVVLSWPHDDDALRKRGGGLFSLSLSLSLFENGPPKALSKTTMNVRSCASVEY